MFRNPLEERGEGFATRAIRFLNKVLSAHYVRTHYARMGCATRRCA